MDLFKFLLSQRKTFETGSWILGEAVVNNLPCRFRVRSTRPLGVSTKVYSCLLRITLYTQNEAACGVNAAFLTEAQIQFEEVMEDIEEHLFGAMMFALYAEDRSEWFWYVSDVSSWMQDFIHALKGHPIYSIEVEQIEDHHWSIWEQLRFGNTLHS